MKRTLGTCYYPEHWPRDMWEEDARRMVDAGLTWVRIGEFAWSRIEPVPDQYQWEWLDQAIEVLGRAGLKVVLGTPTATPPRWMLDRHPDMLAIDAHGRPRKFGSRRHYCFSHEGYKEECVRIVTALAQRYGQNTHVAACQTDNEYGCHDTTISYSSAARDAYRNWLSQRYNGITALNEAWGNTFWSMEYDDFDQIDLPNLTVTEPSPAHQMTFRRFSSDQVAVFNRMQTDAIRALSDAPITHNYMGRITDFDHFAVGANLDIASWDSYPLGFLEDRIDADDNHKRQFACQGDPDFQAFHHDLYRAVGRGRWWVMEQQPGPVNWAPHNPVPLPGMVRLWSWEAFAHGAEAVCYFRWRQVPFGQEQLHSGLLRPDGKDAAGLDEARIVATEIAMAPDVVNTQARVAILFDYDADFGWSVQPHGDGLSYFGLIFDTYKAMRSLGLSIDILPPSTRDFSGYSVIAAPGFMFMPDDLKSALNNAEGQVLLGPRSAARTRDMQIPVPLPPDFPNLDVVVSAVESLRTDMSVDLENGGKLHSYRDHFEGDSSVVEQTKAGDPVVVTNGKVTYIGACLDTVALRRVIERACALEKIETLLLPDGVRIRDTARERFWFNYNANTETVGVLSLPPAAVIRQPMPS
ncbi:MAG: beta-galactosidase [Paracoccaceae bacterium]